MYVQAYVHIECPNRNTPNILIAGSELAMQGNIAN